MDIAITPSGAQFSRCRRWRYLLWRRWDESKPVANFLMLNPSTADELKLDPSCTRARNYAERWGYGGLIVTNIFGWRATDPKVMKSVKDPVGRGNDAAILRAAREAKLVVCAWGNHGEHLGRGQRGIENAESAEDFSPPLAAERRGPALPPALPAADPYSSGIPASFTSLRHSSRSARLTSTSRSGVEPSGE